MNIKKPHQHKNQPIIEWYGKHVWLIGASTGIGAALAQQLIARGAKLALSSRHIDQLAALAEQHPQQAWLLPLDITDISAFEQAHQQVRATFPAIDVVIFMAGAYTSMRAWELNYAGLDKLMDVNLRAPMQASARLIPSLLQQGSGTLVFVASVAGYRGLPKAAGYGPTKAALINFAEALYLDLVPRGLSVYVVNPGFVATPMTAKNDFDMPALISPEEAAQAIFKGLGKSHFEIHFPRRFTCWLKTLRILPYRLYFWLILRFVKA